VTAARRSLRFGSLAEAVADAEGLLVRGYDRAGNWSLARCCGHLANWTAYPMDGFPPPPLWMRPAAWASRNTVGRALLRRMLARGRMPLMPTLPASVPPAGGDDRAGVDDFRRAVGRWQAYTGPLADEPLVGPMTRDDWERLHLIHAARHLSFLVPKAHTHTP
jgi:hypothetical protein